MPEFIITYHGGKPPKSKEEGMEHMRLWGTWVGTLKDYWVNPGSPIGKTKVLTKKGISDTSKNPMTGFSVIRAKNMSEALKLIKKCPALAIGTTLEVSEIKAMPGGQ